MLNISAFNSNTNNNSPSNQSSGKTGPKNKGGFWGGAKYIGQSLLAGVAGIGEGVIDAVVALGADLTGNHEFAEKMFEDNVIGEWREDFTEEYNPGGVMQFLGDVSEGLAQSATLLIPYAGIPLFATGVVSQSISGAEDKTGELGAKEIAYGATIGGVEAAAEALTGGGSKLITGATKSLGKSAAKSAGKSVSKTAIKSTVKTAARKGAVKKILSSAAEEFAEESISEMADVLFSRAYQIDPDRKFSVKDILYAGAVGAVSGGAMAGVGVTISSSRNLARGEKIVKNGNQGTLVDTANFVADKLDKMGTAFDGASEWVTALRGQVDAYNNLSESEKQSAKGKVILGEMQASLYYAETQANVALATEYIKRADPQTKAAWAEYLNNSIPADKRSKTYTVEDITADNEQIAKSLAIMTYAGGMLDLESVTEDMLTEEAINDAVAEENAASTEAQAADAAAIATEAATETPTMPVSGGMPSAFSNNKTPSAFASGRMPSAFGNGAARGMKAAGAAYDINVNAETTGQPAEGAAEGGAQESGADNEEKKPRVTTADNEEEKTKISEKGKNLRSDASNENKGADVAEKGSVKSDKQSEPAKSDAKRESGAENAKSQENASVDLDKAKRDAERVVEWEKKNAPTAEELTKARKLVKGFDNINNRRRLAIIRMLRSADGVSPELVKGVANIMAVNPFSDLEFRFSDLDSAKDKGGFITKIGDRTVAVINSNASLVNTVKGSITHELVHYLEKREGYAEFSKYVLDRAKPEAKKRFKDKYTNHYKNQYKAEEQKKAPNASVEEIADRVAERMSTESFERLIESEVTASLVGEALNSDKLLRQYARRDEKLIKRVLAALKRMFTRLTQSSADKEVSDTVEGMITRFEALLQMPKSDTSKVTDKKYSFSSIAYTFFGQEDMSVADFEAGNYKSTEGYKNYVEECINNMRQTREDFDETKARAEIKKSIDGIVRVAIASKNAGYDIYDSEAQRSTRDSKKRLLFSSLEPNSDYFTSSDISSICDKRKNFAEIYDDIVREEERRGVPKEKRFFSNVNNYFVIHDIMARKGLTQPCKQCYVESMRKNLTPMANAFIKLVTETDENNKSNNQLYSKGKLKEGNAKIRRRIRELLNEEGLSDKMFNLELLTTADGLASLRLQHPLIYETFNSFYGQSKPKMPKEATPFRFGELTALLTDDHGKIKQGLIDKINATGGFRLQSYSDFQIKNFVDVLQVIFEAGTLGLSGHAYTKVPAFLDATSNTNLKRNISVFMYRDGDEWKIDRNDSFPYKLEDIYKLVDADKSGDTGIIAVSQNEDMSAWIMANDHIGYGIPFHKSGMKMDTVRQTDVVTEDGRTVKGYSGIKDHTKSQSETYAKGEDKGKKVKAPINIYSFWDFDSTRMSKKNLIEKNVKRYIDECEKAGYNPKFKEYVSNNDRVLNATLDYAKKLGFAGADATVADISFKYKGYTIPYGYYKFLGDFGMFTPDGKASPHKTLSLADYDFDKAVKFFKDSEKIRRNEMLQQIANGTEREKYRKLLESGEMTLTDLGRVIKEKRDEVVAEVVERKYSIVGENSETADMSALEVARELLQSGTDSETVRKETGWFKGYDGKWRYEIDDSQAIWNLDTAKPDSERLFVFGEKIFKLTDLLDHPALYEAYPQLRDVTVWENPNAHTAGYVVGRGTDAITVRSLANTNLNKDLLTHEIQHLIQNIEGFATGASPDQFNYKAWGEAEYKAYERRNEIASKLYSILRRHGVSITKQDAESVKQSFEVRDGIIDYNFMLIENLADANKRTRELLDEYYKQVQILNLTTPEGQYHAVAGEIEAYDVQARRRMTAEERKNLRPNIDREDVIFSDNRGESYIIKRDSKGREYWEIDSGKDIFKGLNTPEEYRDAAFAFLISNRDNKVVVKDDFGKEIIFIRLSAEEFTQSQESQDLFNNNPTMFEQKMRLIPSLDDILLHSNVNWWSPDHKNHKLFKKNGFENYRGKVRIDNVIFNTIVRVGKANFGDVFYDINLEVDSYLPHTSNSASDINEPTSIDNSIPQNSDLSTDSEEKVSEMRKYDLVDSELNANGEVKDEYFEKVLEKKIAKKKSEIQLAREEGKKLQKEKDAKKLQKMEEKSKENLASQKAKAKEKLASQKAKAKEKLASQKAKAEKAVKKIKEEQKAKTEKKVEAAKIKTKQKTREEMAEKYAYGSSSMNARSYTKKEVATAVSEIEALTDQDVKSLAKGFEIESMSQKNRARLVSDIYIALHEESAKGETGHGSVAVKILATKIARNMIESAQIKDADGKHYRLSEIYDEASLNKIIDRYANQLFKSFANMGEQTGAAYFYSKLRAEREKFKDESADTEDLFKSANAVISEIEKLKENIGYRKRAVNDSTIYMLEKELSKILNSKRQISIDAVMKAVTVWSDFYNSSNALINPQGTLTEVASEYSDSMRLLIDDFLKSRAERKGKKGGRAFNAKEMRLLASIVSNARSILINHDTRYVNGKKTSVREEINNFVQDFLKLSKDKKNPVTKFGKILDKLSNSINEGFFYKVISPITVFRSIEAYAHDGILSRAYQDIQRGSDMASKQRALWLIPFENFLDGKNPDGQKDESLLWENKHGRKKTYRQRLLNETIEHKGQQITVGEAIAYYMSAKRVQASKSIEIEGVSLYDDKNGKFRAEFEGTDPMTIQKELSKHFTDLDYKYIEMVEKFLNEPARKTKYDADVEFAGWSNLVSGYYFPIIKDAFTRDNSVSERPAIENLMLYYKERFQKHTTENAKQIQIVNVQAILDSYITGLSAYVHLSQPMKTFDMIWNTEIWLDESGEMVDPEIVKRAKKDEENTQKFKRYTIRKLVNREWAKADNFVIDLFNDIQGRRKLTDWDRFVSKWTGRWASGVLFLKPKVVVTQTSSLIAATKNISPVNIAAALSVVGKKKAFKNLAERADKYSEIILARSFESGATKSQGNIDKLEDFNKIGGVGIEATDRAMCLLIFRASEIQIEKTMGYKIGTEENGKAAAELADRTIHDTQAMASKSEKSVWQRDTNLLAKTATMFSSDSAKMLSNLYDAACRLKSHSERAKAGDKSYEADIKKDRRNLGRSIAVYLAVTAELTAIAQLFKFLYNKDEEEPKEKRKDVLDDFTSNAIGILPLASEIYDKVVNDYDASIMILDMFNTIADDGSALVGNVIKTASGQNVSRKEIIKPMYNIGKNIGTMFGIPISPAMDTVTGIVRRVSPGLAYASYDSFMYNMSYTADLKKAVETGDEKLAEYILETLYKNEIGGVYTTAELEEIARLYTLTDEDGDHYNVLPQKIGTEINGVTLTKKQRKEFENIYSKASAEVNKLIRSDYYDDLTDAQKAKAVKNIYTLYYNRAAADVAGAEWSNANAYSRLTSNLSALYAAQAYKGGLSTRKETNGAEISVKDQFAQYVKNLGLSKNDELVVLYANGYRDKDTKAKMIAYINSLSVSTEEKQKIAQRLGFDFKNGKAVEKEKE